MMLDKRVVAMYRYDRAHGTSDFDTAVVSVLYPGAPGVSADVLCVRRNTYFYRIGKIRELFDLTSNWAKTACDIVHRARHERHVGFIQSVLGVYPFIFEIQPLTGRLLTGFLNPMHTTNEWTRSWQRYAQPMFGDRSPLFC